MFEILLLFTGPTLTSYCIINISNTHKLYQFDERGFSLIFANSTGAKIDYYYTCLLHISKHRISSQQKVVIGVDT